MADKITGNFEKTCLIYFFPNVLVMMILNGVCEQNDLFIIMVCVSIWIIQLFNESSDPINFFKPFKHH